MIENSSCVRYISSGLVGLVCLAFLLAPAALADESAGEGAQLSVVASNYPLAFFARRIAGDAAEVRQISSGDADPASWRPTRADVRALQSADLILLVGAGYEPWVDWSTLYRSRLVDTSSGYAERLLERELLPTHSHGPEGEHSHGATAFTTWLDLRLAVEQAEAIEGALAHARPRHADRMADNRQTLASELEALDARLRTLVAVDPGRPLLASHPVYSYLQGRYGVHLRSVHWEPDELPSEEEWTRLEETLAEHPARHMIWEGEPLEEVKRRLLQLGVASLVFDPMARAPATGDFITGMAQNAEALEAAYRGSRISPPSSEGRAPDSAGRP